MRAARRSAGSGVLCELWRDVPVPVVWKSFNILVKIAMIHGPCAVFAVRRPHEHFRPLQKYNEDGYNSNELEELRRKQQQSRTQLEELLEERCRSLLVAALVTLKPVAHVAACHFAGGRPRAVAFLRPARGIGQGFGLSC